MILDNHAAVIKNMISSDKFIFFGCWVCAPNTLCDRDHFGPCNLCQVLDLNLFYHFSLVPFCSGVVFCNNEIMFNFFVLFLIRKIENSTQNRVLDPKYELPVNWRSDRKGKQNRTDWR
ncbi:hypothetical protein XENORESO_021551 [Xenotaenia resolanae]|uniref:Uncharacterized protein n=1 Tax=Xenotaenia resolanae TaxID=208358 RepID=A0ABV0WKT9_9TELE